MSNNNSNINTNKATKETANASKEHLEAVLEAQTPEEVPAVDIKAQESAVASEATESVKLGWTDIAMGSGLAAFSTFARRAATKLMVEDYNEATGESVGSDSWGSIAAHTAVSAVVTGAIVGVCQKTVMKNVHPIRQGGIVIATSQAVNLIDALVGNAAANAIVGGKTKLSDMMSSESEVVAA